MRYVMSILLLCSAIVLFAACGSSSLDDNVKPTTTASSLNTADPRVQKLINEARHGAFKSADALKARAYEAGFTKSEVDEIVKLISVSPLQAQQPAQQPSSSCPGDVHVDAGKEVEVQSGCFVKGDVKVKIGGVFVEKYDSDPATSTVISCPNGCTIMAPWGANVTPRDFEDIKAELLSSGCGSKCTNVDLFVVDNGSKGNPTAAPTSAPPTAVPTPNQILNDKCEPELKLGEKRIVKAGCIVVGDVAARPAGSSEEFKPKHDSRQKTGTVMLLDKDYEIWNYQGASVMPEDQTLEDIVSATKMAGCGTGYGCPDGIFDWTGKRLDK